MSDIGFDLDDLTTEAPRDPCPWAEQTRGKPKWVHCCDGYGHAKSDGVWRRCGDHWPNHEALNHCAICHLTFASLASFDAHRVGPHGETRTCLPVADLTANGWIHTPGQSGLVDTWTAPAKGKK